MKELLPFCRTKYQRKLIEALDRTGGRLARAAEMLDIDLSNASKSLKNIKEYAIKTAGPDYANTPQPTFEGGSWNGDTTLYKGGPDDDFALKWIKRKPDQVRAEAAITAVVESLSGGITPFRRTAAPRKNETGLCSEYLITDFHIGQYSWGAETGEDWDIKIAEDVFLNAFHDMMDGTPSSERALFVQLGDFLDWDGLEPLTPTGRNLMDADSRYPMLVEVAIRCCMRAIELLLTKHKEVHVICAEGNHDLSGAVWLRQLLRVAFTNNPRVTFDMSIMPFYATTWGNTFLGYHHGHLCTFDRMAGKFYSEPSFRKMMANAEYIYLKRGHYHTNQQDVKDGANIEQVPTLSARSAYSARKYTMTDRRTRSVTYDLLHGEIDRKTVTPRT